MTAVKNCVWVGDGGSIAVLGYCRNKRYKCAFWLAFSIGNVCICVRNKICPSEIETLHHTLFIMAETSHIVSLLWLQHESVFTPEQFTQGKVTYIMVQSKANSPSPTHVFPILRPRPGMPWSLTRVHSLPSLVFFVWTSYSTSTVLGLSKSHSQSWLLALRTERGKEGVNL